MIYSATTTGYASTAAGTAGQLLKSNGTNAPTWTALSAAGVAASGANSDITSLTNLTTALSAGLGGTGQLGNYAVGDLLYASGTTALSKLQAVASGSALISNGTGAAPSWGTPNRATNLVGGNNNSLLGAMPYQSNTDTTTLLAPNTTATKKFLTMTGTGSNGAAPAWVTLAVSDLSAGTLAVANGGTGATTLSGYVYGNGTGAMTAVTTIPVSAGGTGTATAPTAAGGMIYASSTSAYGSTSAGSSGQVLLSGGTGAPTWGTPATATNLVGGVAGAVPYQSAAGATGFSAAGSTGQPLLSGASGVPTWGTLAVTAGGTGTTTAPTQGGVIYSATTTGYASTAAGTSGQLLKSNGTSSPAWTTLAAAGVAASGTNNDILSLTGLTTALSAGQGGTGQTIYAVGDLLYASATTALSKLADVAVGSALISGGVGVAPSWGTPASATKVSNLVGGNSSTLLGAMPYQSNTDTTTLLAPNTTSTKKFLTMTGTGTNGAAPAWGTLALSDVASGTLPVASGGTGSSNGSITGTGELAFKAVGGDLKLEAGNNCTLQLSINGTGTVYSNGPIGINTLTPQYPLHVEAKISKAIGGFGYITSYGVTGNVPLGGTADFSAYFSGRILVTGDLDVASDARVKEVQARREGATALEGINRLQITDYRYVDKVDKGNGLRTGVLAQEAEQVFPDAVHRTRDFIPDLFVLADSAEHQAAAKTLMLALPKAHNLKVGDRVRYVGEQGRREKRVLSLQDDRTFTLGEVDQAESKVFVIGKEVDDFRVVNYEDLFTNGLAAIQELSRQNDALKAEVAGMKTQLAEVEALKAQLAAILARLPK